MVDSTTLSSLSRSAIDAALEGRWQDSLKINNKIIKEDPQNIDALNRIARANFELGKMSLAKKYYNLALKSDPYNPIAIKNLKIISVFKKNDQSFSNTNDNPTVQKISPLLFLEEPGKTKVVPLLKVAEPQKLSRVFPGMPIVFSIRNHKIHVLSSDNSYLGSLPDDLSHHMLRLLKRGNKYDAFIKSVKINGLSILIRETFRSKYFKNQPSFLDSYTTPSPNIIAPLISPLSSYDETDSEEQQPD